MKNLSKGSRLVLKIGLALAPIALALAKGCTSPAPATPATYHLEASYGPDKGGKVIFDKH